MKSSDRPELDDVWAAVLARSRVHDGQFVYAVKTTGVYCRPTYSSRRPRRENVEFFPAPAAAERRGYRACLRCRPREEPPLHALVAQICATIDAAAARGERVTLKELGAAVERSPAHLQRIFKRATGVSPRAYAAERRLAAFRGGLRTADTVTRAVYDAGFGSGSRAYEPSDAQLGAKRPGARSSRRTGTSLRRKVGRGETPATPRRHLLGHARPRARVRDS